MTIAAASPVMSINVGPLNGLGSFCMYTAKALKQFSDLYREGYKPEVEWDLSSIEPRHMSMAGLTAFLATAHRLRSFTKKPLPVRIPWNPQVFSFLEDISFFRIAEQNHLLAWPEGVGVGFSTGENNPNTELLMYPYTGNIPDRLSKEEDWKNWKDRVRERFKDDLLLRCGRLFKPSRKRGEFSNKLRDEITITCAELVVNSLLWGHSAAFVGLQRSPAGITIAVCDSGRGFLTSLNEKPSNKVGARIQDYTQALVYGALINTREFGLRRVINMVVEAGGKVIMSSYDAEIHWRNNLWYKAKAIARGIDSTTFDPCELLKALGDPITGRTTYEDQEGGFYRVWGHGLRGSRITFEIPFPV